MSDTTYSILNIRRKPETPSTRNVLLKNMFSQQIKSEENWAEDLRDDVKAECSKYGKLLHVGVDENSTVS